MPVKFAFNKFSKISIQILLGLLFLISVVQFLYRADKFARNILQEDFSAYYAAGQSLNHGLTPYLNNFANIPPIWDGVANYRYSRFLYPPLVAALFQPLALIPYAIAKYVWMGITLLCLIASLFLTARLFPLKSPGQVFLIGIAVCSFYPLSTHLERGQIDLATLLAITASILLMTNHTRVGDTFSGFLLILATLLKLNCIYILPFLVIKRRWIVIRGYIYGAVLIVLASVVLFKGPRSLYDYVRYQLPRIAGLVTVNDGIGKANRNLISSFTQNLPAGDTVMDGDKYQISYYPQQLPNATLVAPIKNFLTISNLDMPRSIISVLLYVALFLLYLLWMWKYTRPIESNQKEFLFWQIPILFILLTAPLTWIMNAVWLLPLAIVIVSYSTGSMTRARWSAILIMCVGFLGVLVDPSAFDVPNVLGMGKVLLGELMILFSLMFFLSIPSENSETAHRYDVKSISQTIHPEEKP